MFLPVPTSLLLNLPQKLLFNNVESISNVRNIFDIRN